MREHQRSRSKEPAGSDWGFGRLHGPPPPLLTTTQILSKVQLASILPLKSPTSFHTSPQSPATPSILPLKSPSTFHTAFQKSNHLPYFLANVQPASILSLKSQTTFHTSSQKFNQSCLARLPLFFFTKMAVVEKSIRRCRIDCLAEG